MGDPFKVDQQSWLPGSAGPSTGFFENFNAAYDQQYHVDSMYGMEDDVFQRWQKSLSQLELATNQRFDMPLEHRDINNYVSAVEGKDPSIFYQPITLHGFDPNELIKKREPFLAANEAIKSLNDPNIQSMEEIVKAVKEERAAVSQRSAEASDTGGIIGTLGQFAGGIVGSFTGRDPLNVATLPVGGFGKTAAMRIATEMGLMGGISAVDEYAAVEPTKELLGEDPGSPFTNVVYSMIGAGLFRGGLEVGGKILGKINEGRAAPFLENEKLANESWINSDKLKQMFEAQPDSPSARAGLHILSSEELIKIHNPYGDNEVGRRLFMADIEDIERVANGKTDTAIARFLPDQPLNLANLDVDTELVRAARPEIVSTLEDAQARLAEVDQKITSTQESIGNLSVADAIERVDPDSGNLARSLEDDLRNSQLTSKQRQTITQKLDQIVESLGGAERIANEAKNSAIKPKKELQTLRASRRAAAKVLRQARNTFDEAVEQVKAEAKVRERLNKPVKDGRIPSRTSFDPSGNRPDVAATRSKVVSDTEAALDNTSESIVSSMETEDGKIDLGNGEVVDPDFKITDPDNPEREITIRELANEMKLDDQLLTAMKECSV